MAPREENGASELTAEFRARYQVRTTLGAGGMGVVSEALDLVTRRVVAVKFLRGQHSPDWTRRFLREGRLMAQIDHPSMARIYDMDTMEGHPYLVMEFLGGGSLRGRMARDGAMPVREAVRIALECLGALEACHDRRLIHRDIKPENVLFDDAGRARVTDLGIALDIAQIERLTRTGALLGTARYAAPEVFLGLDAGPAADVYAMGLVFYEMLAGRPPVLATSHAALVAERLAAGPPEPAALRVAIPSWAWSVIRVALARSPEHRPPTAAAFAAELRAAHAGAGSRGQRSETSHGMAPRTATGSPVSSRASTRRAALGAGLVGLAALGLLCVVAAERARPQDPGCRDLSVTPSRSRAHITWRTERPAITRLWVWEASGSREAARPVPVGTAGASRMHHALDLKSLDPAGTYRFRLEGEADAAHPLELMASPPSLPRDPARPTGGGDPFLSTAPRKKVDISCPCPCP